MNKEDLIKLINDDDQGLLVIKTNSSSPITVDERLVSSFLEINNFVKDNKREPLPGSDLLEHQLASRLKSIREDKNKIKVLLDYDEFNLLDIKSKEINSIKDIFTDEDFKVLDNTDEKLFLLENVPKQIDRSVPDYVARRKPCKGFAKYENLFQECQAKLKAGALRLKRLEKHRELSKGSFFVLGGVLGLIESTSKLEINDQNKLNGRLHIIFENGTESNMLLQSLIKSMQDQYGRLVTNEPPLLEQLVNEKDSYSGYIYILKSLSTNPKINSIENLYKIGYSTIPVEERIKNASNEPAYLMAPAKIVTTFECYNFNPQKLEQLLHNFFGAACLNIDIFDQNNNRYMPREWFIAPIDVIETTINLIIDGEIVNYKYDTLKKKIILR